MDCSLYTQSSWPTNELVRDTNMGGPTRSRSELIEAYLDAVMRKDTSVIERWVAQDVEYVVNGTPVPDAKWSVFHPSVKRRRSRLEWRMA